MRRHGREIVVGIGVVVGSLVFAAAPASAHIDPEPAEAQPGSRLSVGFTVEHGCQGSPTVQLDMRLPDGVTDAVPEPPTDWTGSLDGNVVTFTGGPLPADVEQTFRVLMTLPSTPDVTVYFPFVQRCETGEVRWISLPVEGSTTELDQPAPAMDLRGPIATTVALPVEPTTMEPLPVEPTTTSPTVSTSPSTTIPTDTVEDSTTTTIARGPSSTTVGAPTAAGSTGVAVLAGSVAAMAALAGVATWQVRRRRS